MITFAADSGFTTADIIELLLLAIILVLLLIPFRRV